MCFGRQVQAPRGQAETACPVRAWPLLSQWSSLWKLGLSVPSEQLLSSLPVQLLCLGLLCSWSKMLRVPGALCRGAGASVKNVCPQKRSLVHREFILRRAYPSCTAASHHAIHLRRSWSPDRTSVAWL